MKTIDELVEIAERARRRFEHKEKVMVFVQMARLAMMAQKEYCVIENDFFRYKFIDWDSFAKDLKEKGYGVYFYFEDGRKDGVRISWVA